MLVVALVVLSAAIGCLSAPEADRGQRSKRELPLNLQCDVRSNDPGKRCYKGDLLDESVADCERTFTFFQWTCDPVGDKWLSTSTDVADPENHGVECLPVSSKPVTCGESDTRCVCDAPLDFTSTLRRPYFNNYCRCQYWPAVDERTRRLSVCRQYDHGGQSNIHFYACCDNCGDTDRSCDGHTYQGGGTYDDQCGKCGARIPSERGSRLTYTFNCETCSHQRHCKKTCDTEYPISAVMPGLCPKWIGCFRACCLSANPENRG